MEILYSSDKVKTQCESLAKAKKMFGGDERAAQSLLSRINALIQAETLKDIVVQPQFRFHALTNKQGRDLRGYFSVDVKTKKDPWRIVFQPLDDEKNPFEPCHIDEIASIVRIVDVLEVSKHYG